MADVCRRPLAGRWLWVAVPLALALGCGDVPPGPGPLLGTEGANARELPLLAPGNHAGTIAGFSGVLPLVTGLEVESRWAEALERGMGVTRLQIDWIDLEPSKENYQVGEFHERLAALSSQGVAPTLTIGIGLDDFFVNMPPDLRDRVRSGAIAYNSPEVTDRFARLLDRIVPLFVEHRGWLVAVGNEPGNTLDDDDDPLALATVLADFVSKAKTHIHSIEPRLAVTVTLREDLSLAADRPFLATLLEVTDVAAFNFYCSRFSDALLVERDPALINGYIDRMLEAAGSKPLVVMELGCHAGYADRPSPTQSSPEVQSQFYRIAFDRLAMEPSFRAAIAFQLVDWSPTLVSGEYSELFRAEGLDDIQIEWSR